MRNIILIHLESLSFLNYRMNSYMFPTLKEIEKTSLFFSNYRASATSTLMVLSDLAYGSVYPNEPCAAVHWDLKKPIQETSILDIAKHQGYTVKAVAYPDNKAGDVVAANNNNFIGKSVKLDEAKSYNEYIKEIEKTVSGQAPFFLWAISYISNSSYNYYVDEEEKKDGIERYKRGYCKVDNEVNDILKLVKSYGHMDDTSIILYGDHGDEVYYHGMHGGLTHTIEPYETQIHTPLFLVDSRLKCGEDRRLLNTIDLKELIKNLLFEKKDAFLLSNLDMAKRNYSFSRSLFAAQPIREGVFDKGYSVTDGDYLLMCSEHGLELYNLLMDPGCAYNLLECFEFADNHLKINDKYVNTFKFHFPNIFDTCSLKSVADVFVDLREKLISWIKALYEYAECSHRLYELDFHSIRSLHLTNKAESINVKFTSFEKYFINKKVVIYGAGQYGTNVISEISNICEVVAWVDQNWRDMEGENHIIRVMSPENLLEKEFDLIFFAILDGFAKQKAMQKIESMGIPISKML